MPAKPNKRKPLNWEYCECGCHGSELRIAGLYFWKFVEVENMKVVGIYIHDSHKWGTLLGSFKTSDEAYNFIVKRLKAARAELNKVLGK